MSSALPSADTCTKKWLAPGQHALAASHAPHSRLTSPVSSTHGAVAHHGSHESMCVATQLVKNTLILALPGFPGPAVQLCELSCRLWVTFKSPPLHHNTQHNIEHITAISAALARVCTLTRHSAQRGPHTALCHAHRLTRTTHKIASAYEPIGELMPMRTQPMRAKKMAAPSTA